ncbi:MAG: MlaD family protein [Mycobacterium sp.]|nr:MlaD family protein [Mycobacterium sp.]
MMRRAFRLMLAMVSSLSISSCSAITVNDLPQPGTSYRDGYDLVIEFASVLNLPDRAKVVMDGTTVGVVEKVSVAKSVVDVTARIDGSVKVPSDVRAILQQATVLGDIYVALDRDLTRPSDGASALPPGGRIPVSQTTSPPQLEDTIASMANFVASGSIQRVQNTIINVNKVTPQRAEQVRAIASQVSRDLADLSTNIDTVDKWLKGVSGTVDVMSTNLPLYQYWFSPAGMTAFSRTLEASIAISTLLPSIGSIYTGGFWLVPLLDSLGTAVGAIQKSKWAVEGEYRPWRKLFTEMFLPEDRYPAMNITSVVTTDGRDITNNVQDVLRMLGATP